DLADAGRLPRPGHRPPDLLRPLAGRAGLPARRRRTSRRCQHLLPPDDHDRCRLMKFAWIDLRAVPEPQQEAVLDAAVHARIAGVLADDEVLQKLPPTVEGIRVSTVANRAELDALTGTGENGWVEVHDEDSLNLACTAATALPNTVVRFADP